MKIKHKSRDKGIKYPFGNILKIYKGINLLNAKICKYNLDILNKFYRDMFRNRMNYNKSLSKALKKSDHTNKASGGNKQDSIDTLPASRGNKQDSIDILTASGHDICNYLARYSMANCQIQAIMKLEGRLDFDKLKRAVRLSVDAEPVFGCQFIEDDPPYWKRLDNIDEITFCSLEETNNSDEAVMSFLQSPLDMVNDPNVKVKIIRLEGYDILGIKVNHACCDGTGTKEYIQLLSYIYSCIDQGDGTFIPEPKIGGRKEQDTLFKELGITCPEVRWNPLLDTNKTMWTFPWIQRGGDSIRFAVCRLPQGSLESIYQYGKPREATVNDLVLTAFYRTMFKISKPIYSVPMDISSTVDLRRYLPDHKTEAIRNLSGGFITRIARIVNESFEGTLYRVVNETRKLKDGSTGVNNAMGEEYVEKTRFTYFHDYFERMSQTTEISAKLPTYIGNVCFPGLSNLGYISKSLISFGKNVVTDAYFIPPVIRAPGFLLLASSYNGVLTMSIGYYKASISQRDMEGLLNIIKNELMRGCGCEN
jgi:NRPS condensation-like uncharacterized protein